MFPSKICLATVLLSLHAANSYILLTANLDDVHSLAKQIAESPVVNQINDIIRRATSTFNDHNLEVRKHNPERIHMRSDPQLDEDPQVNRRHDSMEKTEKNLPHPTQGERLKKPAASETDQDDAEVWNPDKNALASELNSQASDSSSEVSEDNDVKPSLSKHAMRRSNNEEEKQQNKQDNADVVELGRNASFYLTSMKKMFESV